MSDITIREYLTGDCFIPLRMKHEKTAGLRRRSLRLVRIYPILTW
ncbi:MAG: hypothetical protein WCX22_01295 [Methanoregula sp.]